MKKTVQVLSLTLLFCLVSLFIGGCKDSKMQVTFVNQTELPVNMFVSGVTCSDANRVAEQGMRKDYFNVYKGKNSEEFEVSVNNHVLVRKTLKWKKDAKAIMVVYNGTDLLLTY